MKDCEPATEQRVQAMIARMGDIGEQVDMLEVEAKVLIDITDDQRMRIEEAFAKLAAKLEV